MKYLFFDLDGTLTDPFEGIVNSARYALTKLGVEPPSAQELKWVIGPPLHESVVKLGIPRERVSEAVEAFREYYEPTGLYQNQVYSGIDELLHDLKNRGYTLALATSKAVKYAMVVLEHFGLASYFDFVGGAELDGSRSDKGEVIEHVINSLGVTADERSACLMLGDREHDICGANKAGVKSCGVLWGYGSETELSRAGASYIVQSIDELRELLDV
ncbi:MAG: HAD hydrolase-like protein [Oscillospiraceae bacterium]|nr:HAD hydrolase-like protein [Oscillospiraceae bacterium]